MAQLCHINVVKVQTNYKRVLENNLTAGEQTPNISKTPVKMAILFIFITLTDTIPNKIIHLWSH